MDEEAVHTRRCTTTPTRAWFSQQARDLGLDFADQGIAFLLRNRDRTCSRPFNEEFRSEQIRIVETPVRASRASGIAERFVRTARAVCLDRLLVLNRQLVRRPRVYVGHCNRQRPRRALELGPPEPEKQQAKSTPARSAAGTGSAGTTEYHLAAA